MTDLPAHVGRQTDEETGYALVCNATPDGNPHTDAICGKPATHHLRWEEATTENSFACDGHLGFALNFGPFDVHSVEDSACGMPGAQWVTGKPSHCSMQVLDEEPALVGAAYLHTLTEPCATSNEVVRVAESDLRPVTT